MSSNNSSWAIWALGAMGTLLLFVSSLYAASLNASVNDVKLQADVIQTNQRNIGERVATLEEAVKQIGELKLAIRELTVAVNESNRRNPR